ncbi:uncharacterized protein B0I36DRAFT_347038 [Microdochium trichocladiopsis]|uniref:Uncharacterized protein n=1 Tax=Microdochium trichocladiopsis TaxID=1682393 RepID=A0A9P8YBH9_9PEZI|nr:uncharacterized protein B0I36DRAFT_347038 [Microdochium trichocladiopsis]KAH7035227.1 hypothetical protein B0I36DRAFT_347038 [Microdochium trichocladiopsis]
MFVTDACLASDLVFPNVGITTTIRPSKNTTRHNRRLERERAEASSFFPIQLNEPTTNIVSNEKTSVVDAQADLFPKPGMSGIFPFDHEKEKMVHRHIQEQSHPIELEDINYAQPLEEPATQKTGASRSLMSLHRVRSSSLSTTEHTAASYGDEMFDMYRETLFATGVFRNTGIDIIADGMVCSAESHPDETDVYARRLEGLRSEGARPTSCSRTTLATGEAPLQSTNVHVSGVACSPFPGPSPSAEQSRTQDMITTQHTETKPPMHYVTHHINQQDCVKLGDAGRSSDKSCVNPVERSKELCAHLSLQQASPAGDQHEQQDGDRGKEAIHELDLDCQYRDTGESLYGTVDPSQQTPPLLSSCSGGHPHSQHHRHSPSPRPCCDGHHAIAQSQEAASDVVPLPQIPSSGLTHMACLPSLPRHCQRDTIDTLSREICDDTQLQQYNAGRPAYGSDENRRSAPNSLHYHIHSHSPEDGVNAMQDEDIMGHSDLRAVFDESAYNNAAEGWFSNDRMEYQDMLDFWRPNSFRTM